MSHLTNRLQTSSSLSSPLTRVFAVVSTPPFPKPPDALSTMHQIHGHLWLVLRPMMLLLSPLSPIMVIGDKSKAQLSHALPSNLQLTFNQIGRNIPTFADAAGLADLITQSGVKYDSKSVARVYNNACAWYDCSNSLFIVFFPCSSPFYSARPPWTMLPRTPRR